MRKILFICISITILMGGCNLLSFEKDIAEMDPKDLPDVPAFQDDFTREFMASTEEVEDGYYVFQSKTGGYTMMYPEDARMNPTYYQNNKENFETVQFGSDYEKITDDFYYVRLTNYKGEKTKDISRIFRHLNNSIHYNGDYEKIMHEDNIIFFATSKYTGKSKDWKTYRFFGVVKSINSDQAISYLYNVLCEDEREGCNYDMDRIEQHVKKLMNSIEFISED